MMVKNIKEALHDAGVDSKYIAAEVVRIYSDSGYPVNAPLISDTPKLWDCSTIARELGIFRKLVDRTTRQLAQLSRSWIFLQMKS